MQRKIKTATSPHRASCSRMKLNSLKNRKFIKSKKTRKKKSLMRKKKMS